MRKTYSKPEILFENFSVSTNIAAGCEAKTHTPNSAEGCGLDFSGVMVFVMGMNGCSDIQVTDEGGDGRFNKICYHNPYGENVFNS